MAAVSTGGQTRRSTRIRDKRKREEEDGDGDGDDVFEGLVPLSDICGESQSDPVDPDDLEHPEDERARKEEASFKLLHRNERAKKEEEARNVAAKFDMIIFRNIATKMKNPTRLLRALALSVYSDEVLSDEELWRKSFSSRGTLTMGEVQEQLVLSNEQASKLPRTELLVRRHRYHWYKKYNYAMPASFDSAMSLFEGMAGLRKRSRQRVKLESELAKLGLTRRYDSRLCDAFESGGALAHGWSAAGVAKKMAQMHYLHGGFCPEYTKIVGDMEGRLQDTVDELAEENYDSYDRHYDRDGKRYYSGIRGDACRELFGTRDIGQALRDVADTWTKWPERWPWLENEGKKVQGNCIEY